MKVRKVRPDKGVERRKGTSRNARANPPTTAPRLGKKPRQPPNRLRAIQKIRQPPRRLRAKQKLRQPPRRTWAKKMPRQPPNRLKAKTEAPSTAEPIEGQKEAPPTTAPLEGQTQPAGESYREAAVLWARPMLRPCYDDPVDDVGHHYDFSKTLRTSYAGEILRRVVDAARNVLPTAYLCSPYDVDSMFGAPNTVA